MRHLRLAVNLANKTVKCHLYANLLLVYNNAILTDVITISCS